MTAEQRAELVGVVCDSIEYFCDENMISGEEAWRNVQDLVTIKLQQMRRNRL